MTNERKKIDLKKCIAVTASNYFYQDKDKKWKVRDCYKDKPVAKVEKDKLNLVTSTRKDKKVYIGDFSELNRDVKGYAMDRMFNHGKNSSAGIYLVEAEKPAKKVTMAMNNYNKNKAAQKGKNKK